MRLTPDELIIFHIGGLAINATIFNTWIVMALLVVVSWLITRNISAALEIPPGQNFLEIIVGGIRDQIAQIGGERPELYLPFVGTLFLYIVTSNVMEMIPHFHAPTASLSTTAALALCVFVAVPIYGISKRGLFGYLRQYIEPTPLMLPFHVISEISRTMALAVRLFGNMMSTAMIIAILLGIVPLLFPVAMGLLGLLTGVVHAYIFAVLAMVYIASATRAQRGAPREEEDEDQHEAAGNAE